jgi:hypothetical protein
VNSDLRIFVEKKKIFVPTHNSVYSSWAEKEYKNTAFRRWNVPVAHQANLPSRIIEFIKENREV